MADYLSFLEDQDLQRQQGEAARLAGVSTLTYGVNPDDVAKARKTAGFLGVPPAVVEATPEESARQAQFKKIDLDTAQAPTLRQRYTDADFHKLASDDSGVLGTIESAVRSFLAPKRPQGIDGGPRVVTGAEFGQLVRQVKAQNPAIGFDEARTLAMQMVTVDNSPGGIRPSTGPAPTVGSVLRGLGTSFVQGAEQARQGMRMYLDDALGFDSTDAATKFTRAGNKIQLATPEFDSSTARGLFAGGVSTLQQAPGLAMSIMLGNPAPVLATIGAQTGLTSYGKFRARGGTANEALAGGALDAAIEIGTEMLPMSFLVNKMGKAGAGEFLRGLLARELPTEQIATLAQDAVDTAIANPDKTWAQYVAERPEAAYQTLLATLVQSGVVGGAHTVLERTAMRAQAEEYRAQQAEAGAGALQQIMQLAAASKVRERDAATFQGFLQSATEDGPLEKVYVSPRELQEAGVDLTALAEVAPSIASELAQAAETGVDVAIPTAELATLLPGNVLEQSLLPHLKTDPEGFSQAGAQAYMQTQGEEVRQTVEKVLAEKHLDDKFKAGMREVEQNVLAQLKAANRFTEDVNAPYAALWSAFFGVQAARLGAMPQELYQRFAPRIVAQTAAGALLDQDVPLRQQGGQALKDVLKGWTDAGISHTVSEKDDVITVSKIVVPEDERGAGKGTAAMRALVAYADATGKHVALTPASDFGGNRARLVKFYKRFGFVENKGKNRAFTTSESMYRLAPGKTLEQADKAEVTRGSFDPNTNTLALLKAADLSTFLHESGHFFLEVLADLAAQPDAPQQIKDDFATFLKWTGVEAPEAWAKMTLDEQRAHHEDFARGFEAYLFEGKAPSVELAGLFQRFRAWLLNVYRTVAGLNVNLNTEIRQVFDRMLATTEQIKLAEDVRGFEALFKNKPEGMTADEWAVYQIQANDATQQAITELEARSLRDMQWLTNAKGRELKRLQKEAKTRRAEIEAEVRAEVEAQPVYRAREAIRQARRSDPAERAAAKAWGEQRDAERARLAEVVKQQYLDTPEGQATKGIERGQFLARNKRAMANEVERMVLQWEQQSPRPKVNIPDADLEAMAQLSDGAFTSADHLRRALDEAPPIAEVIEGMTDQRMLERHADLVDERAIERAAEEAIHNDARLRFTATELNALRKAAGQPAVLASAVRQFAADIVARTKVRDLRPSVYTAAERRAALDAAKAAAKNDLQDAAIQKRNQLINGHAAKAVLTAQDEVKVVVDYFRKFDKRSETIDPGYQDQIEALLERFDFRPASLKEIDRRQGLAAWYAEQEANGHAPSIPEDLLDEARRTHYRNLTVEELRGLRDTVKQIEHIGRLKNKLLLARDQRAFDAIATEMAQSIVDNGGKARPVEIEAATGFVPWMAGLAAMHRKLSSLFRQMDGNRDHGPMYEMIGRAMNERGTMEDVMVERATKALQAIYAPVVALPGGVSGYRSKVFIPEINASLTRGGRLAVALNWGNEANRQRILDGDRWTEGQVQAILRTLSPTELEFVNKVWEYLDSYWPEIAAKEKRLTGVEPEKVQAVPFTLTLPDGTAVKMRGGYYPLKYDANRSDRASQQEAAEAAKEMMRGAFTRATTRRGHTKARVDEVNRAVRKDLNVITQHVTQVVHDLAWHEWLIDTNKLLSDRRVVSAIRDHYGPAVLKTIRDDVAGIATADVVPQTDIDAALLVLRSNVSRATMGVSLTTAFLQPFGLTQSVVRIGPRHVLSGAAKWAGDAVRLENTLGWIRGKSDFMRLRAQTFNKELREIRGSVAGKSATMKVIDAGLFALMQKMQLVADVPTWLGQYQKSLAEGLDEAAAITMADRAVLESQGGGQTKDLAEVQRKHPMLTQFYSYFSVTLNLATESTAATDFKNPRAVAGWLGDMALLLVIPAILPALIVHLARGGDDDEIAKHIAEWQLSYLMGLVVGVRELSGAVSGFDYAGPPVGRVIADLGKAGQQTAQGELDEPAVLAYVRLMGSAFGIPTVQAIRSYRGWLAWDQGDAPASAILFGPPPRD